MHQTKEDAWRAFEQSGGVFQYLTYRKMDHEAEENRLIQRKKETEGGCGVGYCTSGRHCDP